MAERTLVFGLSILALGQSISASCLPTVDLGYQTHEALSFDSESQLYTFTNIPYADPPLGDLRFQAPRPPSWTSSEVQRGEREQTCPQAIPLWQINAGIPSSPTDGPGITEDCLVLDVVVPKSVFHADDETNRQIKTPVLVFIHGGGYTYGHKNIFGSPEGIIEASSVNGRPNLVYVTLNYRLGAFGWLSGASVQANGTTNVGLWDQRLAIEWVKQHIAKFGGDPDNITIMGESAGGGSVMHQISAFGGSRGAPFQRAIPQSPGFMPITDQGRQEQTHKDFLKILSVDSLDQARALPSSVLLEANLRQVGAATYGTYVYGPAVDNDFVPDVASKLFIDGSFVKDVKILSAYNAHEGALFQDPSIVDETMVTELVRRVFPDMSADTLEYLLDVVYPAVYNGSYPYASLSERIELYLTEALFACNHNAMLRAVDDPDSSYGYRFSVSRGWHGDDLAYTFHPSAGPVQDDHVAKLMQSYIAGFAANGDPNSNDPDVAFPKFGAESRIIDLNTTRSVIEDPSMNDRCAFWQKALF